MYDGVKNGTSEIRKCSVCQKEFKIHKSRLKRSEKSGQCCSSKCYGQQKSLNLDKEIIAINYKNGKTLAQIAEELGTTQMTILRRLKEMGVDRKSATNWMSGSLNPMFNKTHSCETRQKIREATLKQFSDPDARKRHGILTAKQISQGRTGKKNNTLERELTKIIRLNVTKDFVTQYRINRHVFDFYIPKFNLLIEADGTFWHADPRRYPDRSKLSIVQLKNLENDKIKNELATKEGYKLIRIWEFDVFNNPSEVIEIIKNGSE